MGNNRVSCGKVRQHITRAVKPPHSCDGGGQEVMTGDELSLTPVGLKCAQLVFHRFCTFVMMLWPLLSKRWHRLSHCFCMYLLFIVYVFFMIKGKSTESLLLDLQVHISLWCSIYLTRPWCVICTHSLSSAKCSMQILAIIIIMSI